MSFLLLEAVNIKKSFAGVPLLEINSLRIYEGDKVGFVGPNGCGKTTLLNILSGAFEPDEGIVKRSCEIAYAAQFGGARFEHAEYNPHALSEFKIANKTENDFLSGGEATRLKLAAALGGDKPLLFADEPTMNLDAEGIESFGKFLSKFESFIVISHDRALLNRYCNRVMTIENRGVVFYEGGYNEYKAQIEAKRERAAFEYERYAEEKKRLTDVCSDKKSKAAKAAKKPKGVSGGEIKQRDFVAVRRSFDGKQRSFDRAAKAVQARIDQMEIKERPSAQPAMKLDFSLTDPPRNKIVIAGREISFAYGNKTVFERASFEIENGERAELRGINGSGKTTLLNLICNGNVNIYKPPKARVGYFYQGFENIDLNATVLQNISRESVQPESVARSVLARLLFSRSEINKPAGVLSGGECVKLGLAKLLVSRCNVLLLDEPTNFLDVESLEVLQSILSGYEGAMIFVSHDRAFAEAVRTSALSIENGKLIKTFINNS